LGNQSDAIVEETINENMSVISGFLLGYKCILKSFNKKEKTCWRNFQKLQFVYLWWRVNYEPYRAKFENLIGRKVDSIELFPASEGFCLPRFSKRKRNVAAFKLRNFL
jgi:hypothetical protein